MVSDVYMFPKVRESSRFFCPKLHMLWFNIVLGFGSLIVHLWLPLYAYKIFTTVLGCVCFNVILKLCCNPSVILFIC